MSDFEKIKGGVTAPSGFRAGGVHCGIKKKDRDLAVILSDSPATAAAVFTENKIKAAPVKYSRSVMKKGPKRLIIANSGCANAATGKAGEDAVMKTVEKVSAVFNVKPDEIVVASTGSIGKELPVDRLYRGIDVLVKRIAEDGGTAAAQAIMTTDTYAKEISVKVPLSSGDIKIGGIAKGAGMINPQMATMLCFLTTDIYITEELLQKALKDAVNKTFNRITVDGDMSTNDTVVILANSRAWNTLITDEKDRDYQVFKQALDFVAKSLALMIVSDGEGATKLIEVKIKGASDDSDAEKIARAVANSSLFKVAMYGESPNWGRILAAIGYSGTQKLKEETISIHLNGCNVVSEGVVLNDQVRGSKTFLQQKDIKVTIDLHLGSSEYTVWTCDFSNKYVDINV